MIIARQSCIIFLEKLSCHSGQTSFSKKLVEQLNSLLTFVSFLLVRVQLIFTKTEQNISS